MSLSRSETKRIIVEMMGGGYSRELDSVKVREAERAADGGSIHDVAGILGVSVEQLSDYYDDLDSHYEDRFVDDQMAWAPMVEYDVYLLSPDRPIEEKNLRSIIDRVIGPNLATEMGRAKSENPAALFSFSVPDGLEKDQLKRALDMDVQVVRRVESMPELSRS